jgi:hypothetical protein
VFCLIPVLSVRITRNGERFRIDALSIEMDRIGTRGTVSADSSKRSYGARLHLSDSGVLLSDSTVDGND